MQTKKHGIIACNKVKCGLKKISRRMIDIDRHACRSFQENVTSFFPESTLYNNSLILRGTN